MGDVLVDDLQEIAVGVADDERFAAQLLTEVGIADDPLQDFLADRHVILTCVLMWLSSRAAAAMPYCARCQKLLLTLPPAGTLASGIHLAQDAFVVFVDIVDEDGR